MEMEPKKHRHRFFTPWYAGDDENDDWISYLNRNFGHLSGEQVPFPDSSWKNYDEDADIHDDVLKALYEAEDLDASGISIIVLNAIVTLQGEVNSADDIQRAEYVVRSIKSVWGVNNDLTVRKETRSIHLS